MEIPSFTKTYHQDTYPAIDASRPELSVKGKRVVITGGGSGIGAATAEAFAVAGAAEIIILGRTEKTLKETQDLIKSKHKDVKVLALIADIADSTSVKKVFDFIAQLGPIDIYVSNAANIAPLKPIDASDLVQYWKVFETNILGALYAIQAVLKNISKDGVVINVSSGAAHGPLLHGNSAYTASKLAGIRLFDFILKENPSLRVFNLQPAINSSTPLATRGFEDIEKDKIPQLPQDTCMLFLYHEVSFANSFLQYNSQPTLWYGCLLPRLLS